MENGSIIMSVLLFFDTPQEVVRYIASTDKTRSELTDAEIDELGKRVLRLLLISMKDTELYLMGHDIDKYQKQIINEIKKYYCNCF